MKELELRKEEKIEISIKQQKQIEHEFIGNIIPHTGHTIWQINDETLEIEKAKFSNTTYHFEGENKKEIITRKGLTYVSALNKRNALKKYVNGENGSRPISDTPLTL